MAAAYVSEIAPVAGDRRFVWTRYEKGGQRVYIGDLEHRTVLAEYPTDDGRLVRQLGATPDGKFAFFVRDGGQEAGLEGTRLAPRLFTVLSVSDPAVRREIPTGVAGVAVSPDSRWLAYAAGQAIWRIDLRDPKLQPVRVVETRGMLRDLVFAPDGETLAFVSDRSMYGHGKYSFVLAYGLTDHRLTYMSPGLGFDQNPVWSPDGKHLAFLRAPMNPRGFRFDDYRTGPPFSLIICDSASGVGRTVFTADLGQGSMFSPVNGVHDYDKLSPPGNLFWTSGDELVFPWEKTGWRLLYAVPSAGGNPRPLLKGDFEVMGVKQSPDRARLLLTTNQGDLIRPRAQVLDVAAGMLTPIATGGQSRALDWCGAGDCVAVRRWSDDAPYPFTSIISASTGKTLGLIETPPDRAGGAIPAMTVSVLRFKAHDGLPLEAVIYRPRLASSNPRRPVLINAHGGSRNQSFPGLSFGANEALPLAAVARGYIYVSLNYRSGEGYGLNFREPGPYGASSNGEGDIADFVDLARVLRERPDVDPARLGVVGGSYGGYIVGNLLARHSDLFAAGASLWGVGDWVRELEQDTGQVLNLNIPTRARVEALASASSATSHLDTWKSPLLLIQGDADTDGHMEANIELVTGLTQRGTPVESFILPDENHGLSLWRSRVTAFETLLSFFDRRMAATASGSSVSSSTD